MVSLPEYLQVRTREVPVEGDLLDFLPASDTPLSWVHQGEGLIGWGEVARLDLSGRDRFANAARWWKRLTERLDVDDEVRLPGTGPVVFATFSFGDETFDAPGSGEGQARENTTGQAVGCSTLVVPEVVVGQRDSVRWITRIGDSESLHSEPESLRPSGLAQHPGPVRYDDGQFTPSEYRAAVSHAVSRMRTSEPGKPDRLEKVVLAHDLLATTSRPLDQRFPLRELAGHYPNCWTFAVDGFLGATPEMLLERTGSTVRSRVLAGTAFLPDGAAIEERAGELAEQLLASAKNRHEHAFAAESMASALRPFCTSMTVPDEPEVMVLPNVVHLATLVTGDLNPDSGAESLLHLVDQVHPTAAVGGTPRDVALRAIDELEGMDRGRYSGPVGWLDGRGNGQFGVALRCAQLQPEPAESGGTRIRLFAGCGIVADSDPESEVAEAAAKLRPMRQALGQLR